MSKIITYQWIEVRKLKLPNNCPAEDRDNE